MKYEVIVTPEAQRCIREAFRYIRRRAPLNAARWLVGLHRQIDTLEQSPQRCPRARECDFLDEDLRQLIYHSHRIVFSIETKRRRVYVLFVRHGKQLALGEEESAESE